MPKQRWRFGSMTAGTSSPCAPAERPMTHRCPAEKERRLARPTRAGFPAAGDWTRRSRERWCASAQSRSIILVAFRARLADRGAGAGSLVVALILDGVDDRLRAVAQAHAKCLVLGRIRVGHTLLGQDFADRRE